MLLSKVLVWLLLVRNISGNIILPSGIFLKYFQSYFVNAVYFFLCSTDHKLVLMKELSFYGLSVAFSEKNMHFNAEYRRGGVIDLRCSYGKEMLFKMGQDKMFNAHTDWLLIETDDPPGEYLSEINALPSSCVTLAQVNETSVSYYDIYRTSDFTELRMRLMSRQTLKQFIPLPKRASRMDFGGITLRAAAAILYPFSFDGFESRNYTEFDIAAKLSYPISTTLLEQLNFKVSLVTVDDFGYRNVSGRLSGLLGLFQRNEIDLSLTAMFMRDERFEAMDWTGDIYDLNNKIIFKQPPLPAVTNIYILPFSASVWIGCALISLLAAVVLRLDAAVKLRGRKPFQQPLSFGEAIIFVVGHISQQGSNLVPQCPSTKTSTFAFSLAGIFFFTSYSANIVRLLQSTSHTINSISDLSRSQLTVIVQDVVYTKPFFEETKNKEEKELYYKKVLPLGEKAYYLPKDGMKLVRSGPYAFKVEEPWGFQIVSDTFEESEKCLLGVLNIFLIPRSCIPVAKRSGYREIITQCVARQRDVGLIVRAKRQWLRSKPTCEGSNKGFANVGFAELRAAFLIVCYAMATSLLMFLFETFYRLKCRRKLISKRTKFFG